MIFIVLPHHILSAVEAKNVERDFRLNLALVCGLPDYFGQWQAMLSPGIRSNVTGFAVPHHDVIFPTFAARTEVWVPGFIPSQFSGL